MKKLFNQLQMDKALIWILVNKSWAVLRGPITLYFIVNYLSVNEQGIWYTFVSLGALSMLAEMGFTGIITQFVSHEYAHLKIRHGFIYGKKRDLDKLFCLIKYAIKFYILVVPIAILILLLVGKWVLASVNNDIFILWLVYSLSGGLQLLISLVQAIIQGFNKVALIQKNIFIGSLLVPLSTWFLLYFHCGLSALILSNIFSMLLMSILFYKETKKIWLQVIKNNIIYQYQWFHEIVHLQWKYALSWISGYFLFHFFTPMIFKYKGAELAGQFGITYSLMRTISGFAMSWVDSKIPKFNILVSRKDFLLLDETFIKSFKISLLIYIFCTLLFILSIFIFKYYNFYNNRFLEPNLIIIFALSETAMMLTAYIGKYIRLYKAEPFYWLSVVLAVFFLVTINFLKFNTFTLLYLFLIILCINWFIALPLSLYITKRFLNQYHNQYI